MKKVIILLLISIAVASCTEKSVKISIENPSDFDRLEDIVEFCIDSLNKDLPLASDKQYLVVNGRGDTLVTQQTYDGKLIFQPQLKAHEVDQFIIVTGNRKEFETKTYAHSQPQRKDDFNWENDKVGFRYYAKELKQYDGPSNGLDLWYKRTNKIVVDEWYQKAYTDKISFHEDHGEGCDPYAVGRTLGAGSIAPFIDGTLVLNENFDSVEIYDNGPLRTTFKLTYPSMEINGESISDSKVISLDAGSQLTKIEQSFGNKAPMTVAVGFVKRDSKDDAVLYNTGDNYFVYQEPVMEPFGQIFLGAIIPQGIDSVLVNSYQYTNPVNKNTFNLSNVIATTTAKPETVLTYYTGFGWNKFGFANVAEFEKYMKEYTSGLNTPFIIKKK